MYMHIREMLEHNSELGNIFNFSIVFIPEGNYLKYALIKGLTNCRIRKNDNLKLN